MQDFGTKFFLLSLGIHKDKYSSDNPIRLKNTFQLSEVSITLAVMGIAEYKRLKAGYSVCQEGPTDLYSPKIVSRSTCECESHCFFFHRHITEKLLFQLQWRFLTCRISMQKKIEIIKVRYPVK